MHAEGCMDRGLEHDKLEGGLQGSVVGHPQLQPNTRGSSEAELDT